MICVLWTQMQHTPCLKDTATIMVLTTSVSGVDIKVATSICIFFKNWIEI